MPKFISLHTKILFAFTVTFSLFFTGISFWVYYTFTTKTNMNLKDDLKRVAIASAKQVDPEELTGLYREGKPNSEGKSDDIRYENQLRILEEIHEINPEISLYVIVKDDSPDNSVNGKEEVVVLVDSWKNIDPSKSSNFLEKCIATNHMIKTLTQGTVEFRDSYQNEWGQWMTFYAPIRDKSGNVIGAIGADMDMKKINKIQTEIKQQILIIFLLSYPVLLFLIYGLSSLLTRRFKALQDYAKDIGEGNYNADIYFSKKLSFYSFDDETIVLTKILEEMAHKIQQREELLSGIFNQVGVGISVSTSDYKFKIVNSTLCNLLGYTEKELLTKTCFDLTYPEDHECSQQYIDKVFNSNFTPPLPLEKRYIHKNGQTIWFETCVTIVKDNQQNFKYFIAVNQDITSRKEMENKLVEAANTDFLTKLWNRAYFMGYLENLLQKRQENPDYVFGLLLIDIDNFKTINDSLGHLVGDQFLINIANHLRKCVTDNDVVARLGGDEFAILLTSIETVEDAVVVAQKIQTAINFPFYVYNQEFFTSASIGIVISNHLSRNNFYVTATDLFRDADIAMYQVKHKDKNNYKIFGKEMYENFIKKITLENELKKAIDEGKLTLFYQPIIDLNTGKLSSIESLVRWFHPELGLLSPDKFLPIAEESKLIIDLGNWVLETACYQLHQWHEKKLLHPNVTVNVNVAGKQFETGNLFNIVIDTLQKTKLSPTNLRLEVTETTISKHSSQISQILQKIKDLGVKIAIDDFGTGYSSLARLRYFPVNQIKIDKAFIKPLNNQPKNIKFLQGIINLCHNLDLEVVCEGIEIEKQKEILIDLNCNYGQGYLFAKPMSVDDFETWVINHSLLEKNYIFR